MGQVVGEYLVDVGSARGRNRLQPSAHHPARKIDDLGSCLEVWGRERRIRAGCRHAREVSDTLPTVVSRVCVYCGSSAGNDPAFSDVARTLGQALAAAGIELVYGGGRVGLMGVVADACLEAGGKVIGVIPQALWDREVGHTGLTELRIARDMHDRKATMETLADGFVALPGGFGTYEELFEQVTWLQIGSHRKPIVVLDVADFYRPLFALVEQATTSGFVKPVHGQLLQRATNADEAIELLRRPSIEPVSKWIDPPEGVA